MIVKWLKRFVNLLAWALFPLAIGIIMWVATDALWAGIIIGGLVAAMKALLAPMVQIGYGRD